jgi:hypothetical protein
MGHELEEVFAWLEAGAAAEYQAGVLVLQKHSGNRSLVNLLLKKESPAHREKLIYELVKVGCGGRMEDVSEVLNHFAQAVQGFAGAAANAAEQLATVLEQAVTQAFSEQPAPEQVPAELQAQADDLTQLMATLYNQRCQLSNRLAELDPADGPRVVGEILALEQQYNALAQKRRNLATAPEQPTAPAEQPAPDAAAPGAEESAAPGIDRAELMKKRQSLMSNRSKARKSAETAKTEAKRSEYAQKVAKLEIELQQVEMQLKA